MPATLELKTTISIGGPVYSGTLALSSGQFVGQIADRTTDIKSWTVMAYDGVSEIWLPLSSLSELQTFSKLKCPALTEDFARSFQAISDGSLKIEIDGIDLDLTDLDFSGIDLPSLDTHAILETGATGTLAAFQGVSDGAFSFSVNGTVYEITGINTSAIASKNEIPEILNYLGNGLYTAYYDAVGEKIKLISGAKGELSAFTALSAPASGTDISGATYLNALDGTAVLTDGTGGNESFQDICSVINEAAGFVICNYDDDGFSFSSRTIGSKGTVGQLAVTGTGTDVSALLSPTEGVITQGVGGSGSNKPAGLLYGDISFADIAAGDVEASIVTGGDALQITRDSVVLEGDLELSDMVDSWTIEKWLATLGVFIKDVDNDRYENRPLS